MPTIKNIVKGETRTIPIPPTNPLERVWDGITQVLLVDENGKEYAFVNVFELDLVSPASVAQTRLKTSFKFNKPQTCEVGELGENWDPVGIRC
jgi:hypothetical protein